MGRRADKARALLPTLALLWLMVALVVAVAPHFLHLPWWVALLWVMSVSWQWLHFKSGLRLPPRLLLAPLTLVACGGVLAHYGTLLGRDAGVALLAVMAALKLLEARFLRDGVVLAFLGYLLLMAYLLFSQSMLMTVYLFVAMLLVLTAQLSLHEPTSSDNSLTQWRRVGRSCGGMALRMTAQSLPVMLILFILFPRIPGPLWSLPSQETSARTGLSDFMEPGKIRDLALSEAVAFRVTFEEGNVLFLNPDNLYWRGPVLEQFDGQRWEWRLGVAHSRLLDYELPANPAPIDYTVTLEPHRQRWLFALDLPARLPQEVGITRQYQLMRQKEPVNDLYRYSMRSQLRYRAPLQGDFDEVLNLRLPSNRNPRTLVIGEQWRQALSPLERVEAGLQLLRQGGYRYTMEAPLLTSEHPVDEFLFTTKAGFCEHFAGAFATLMRASGVPARVVTGYLGGERNGFGDYWIVRQSDAHAWAEVWLEDRGWYRIDPTAAVAPGRVQDGLAGGLGAEEAEALRQRSSWYRRAGLAWDFMNHFWNEWIIAYTPDKQRNLLSRLGFEQVDWRQLTVLMVTALLLLALSFGAVYWWRSRRVRDPLLDLWQRFCAKLARHGVVRQPHEGAKTYTRRAAQRYPERSDLINSIGEQYSLLRYGPPSEGDGGQHYRQRLRQFKQRIATLKL